MVCTASNISFPAPMMRRQQRHGEPIVVTMRFPRSFHPHAALTCVHTRDGRHSFHDTPVLHQASRSSTEQSSLRSCQSPCAVQPRVTRTPARCQVHAGWHGHLLPMSWATLPRSHWSARPLAAHRRGRSRRPPLEAASPPPPAASASATSCLQCQYQPAHTQTRSRGNVISRPSSRVQSTMPEAASCRGLVSPPVSTTACNYPRLDLSHRA